QQAALPQIGFEHSQPAKLKLQSLNDGRGNRPFRADIGWRRDENSQAFQCDFPPWLSRAKVISAYQRTAILAAKNRQNMVEFYPEAFIAKIWPWAWPPPCTTARKASRLSKRRFAVAFERSLDPLR